MKLIFLTWNSGKLQEAQDILWSEIESLDIDLPEIQTISVQEVIEHKAKEWYKILKKPLIVEDTGLEIEAWNSLPGALIKWFIKTVDNEWIIKMMADFANRNARAVTYVGYFDWQKLEIFSWEIKWKIADSPRWENWFCWDKIFIPDWNSKTFAEMTKEEKNAISMRKIAFTKLAEFFKTN